MKEYIKRVLGLEKQSDYVINYFNAANIRSSIYMSVVVVALEIWMILSLTKHVITSGKPRTAAWLASHYGWYVVLLVAGLLVLIYGIRFRMNKVKENSPRWHWYALLWQFTVISIVFGIHVGVDSYAKGDQVLGFLTMVVFIMCIIVWKPLVGTAISVISFAVFYYLAYQKAPISYSNFVNIFTMWITIFMVAISAYNQRISDATKSEQLEKINEKLRKAALTDELTGLPNMRAFRVDAKKRLEEALAAGEVYDIVYQDIEHFSSYNERYGFEAGDTLLKNFAAALLECFDGYPVARYSDDHFVMLVKTSEGHERSFALEQRLHEMEGDIRLTMKGGAYQPKSADVDIDQACDYARVAANTVKKRYDQNFRPYGDKLAQAVQDKQYIINHIDAAIQDQQIQVFYQPLIRTSDETLCGLEALARWRDPDLGLLAPYKFIPILEEYRQIHKLDQEIIRQVCRDLASSKNEPLGQIPVSVNFSRLDFELYDVPATINEIAGSFGVEPKNIDVEITESALTGNAEDLKRIMETIRGNGYSQWLDDFGSGYSSLNVLKDFHFDVLKIDMVFLRGFETNPNCKIILNTIVSLAKQLGMTTLTEGVETREQFEFLQSIGCDKAQGYYFGKPMPREELLAAIESGRLRFA